MQKVESELNEGRETTIKNLENAIEEEKKAQWRAQGQELLIQAKKENVLLQLEAEYRERLMRAYNEVNTKSFFFITIIICICHILITYPSSKKV